MMVITNTHIPQNICVVHKVHDEINWTGSSILGLEVFSLLVKLPKCQWKSPLTTKLLHKYALMNSIKSD